MAVHATPSCTSNNTLSGDQCILLYIICIINRVGWRITVTREFHRIRAILVYSSMSGTHVRFNWAWTTQRTYCAMPGAKLRGAAAKKQHTCRDWGRIGGGAQNRSHVVDHCLAIAAAVATC